MEVGDFMGLLPEELLENIWCRLLEKPLSNEDLLNCRLVCKNWNERISSNSQLWKVACQKLSLNLENSPITEGEEEGYKSIFLKMRKRFRRMKNGGFEFFHVERIIINLHNPPNGVCCRNGNLAIGTQDSVCVLELGPKLRVVSRVDIEPYVYPNCFHFDDSYLVVATSKTGRDTRVIAFKMPRMEKLYTKVQLSRITCVTFSEDIDLLVTASEEFVTFRCLSSGTVHFTRTIIAGALVFVNAMHPIPLPDPLNGCDYVLLCIDDQHLFHRFLFDSGQIAADKIHPLLPYKLDPPCDSLFGSYFRNSFLYLIRSSFDSQISTLVKHDAVSGKFEDLRRFDCDYMNLVGIGRKYACLYLRSLDHTRKVVIYDLEMESEFTSFVIPGNYFKYGDSACCLDHQSWLDGFDGFNDKGVLLVTEVKDGNYYVFRWPE